LPQPIIAYAGIDESGSLLAETSYFTVAAVVTRDLKPLRNIIPRAALRSGKRLKRLRKTVSELKWSNASLRIRSDVLRHLAEVDVEVFALTIHKENRRIADSPENYAILMCELLQSVHRVHPNAAIFLDRHFTSMSQIALVNTMIYRHWAESGTLTLAQVDSHLNPLVQLADFAAGSIYAWYVRQETTFDLIRGKISADKVETWQSIKARWKHKAK
jgi:hypothetical protein